MTPLEELQAAHKRLSELWNRTGGNYWQAGRCDPGEGWFYVQNADTGEQELYTERGTNVDLIVTLHRTINAQLAILSRVAEQSTPVDSADATTRAYYWSASAPYDALRLARAINGEA